VQVSDEAIIAVNREVARRKSPRSLRCGAFANVRRKAPGFFAWRRWVAEASASLFVAFDRLRVTGSRGPPFDRLRANGFKGSAFDRPRTNGARFLIPGPARPLATPFVVSLSNHDRRGPGPEAGGGLA
jgi:hypothetical protein